MKYFAIVYVLAVAPFFSSSVAVPNPGSLDKRLLHWVPPHNILESSQAKLTALFQQQFKDDQTRLNDQLPQQEVTFRALRNLAIEKNSTDIKATVATTRHKVLHHTDAHTSVSKNLKRQTSSVTEKLPFTWGWTWWATSGSSPKPPVSASANTGVISCTGDTGADGKAVSCAGAVGDYFRPSTTNGYLQISANPGYKFDWWCYYVFDYCNTYGFFGIYVGEYTLEGEFIQAVVDQKVTLWNSGGGTAGHGPLSASIYVDSDHFYEVWVWAGGDANADGWSAFWGSEGGFTLSVSVPSISLYLY
ncbi:hypothetical protein BC937DRAFT_88282 [Endogone sp. FLAS-F59071]|nr:hypothetical protein BC937DRAFT_88282 [Endogone sp. FLAS-F59071]|eukprot:RUS23319.1 hypothetical protein BC937DRAFT_88282 [Endogone sp. FLAS-F59071]